MSLISIPYIGWEQRATIIAAQQSAGSTLEHDDYAPEVDNVPWDNETIQGTLVFETNPSPSSPVPVSAGELRLATIEARLDNLEGI